MISDDNADLAGTLAQEGRIVFTCNGVSMRPLIRARRDAIIIEKKNGQRFKRLDTVLFLREDGKYVLHRILKVCDEGYWIVGDNCFYGDDVTDDQVFGVMTMLKRGKRMIRVTDWHYRLYSHLWCDVYPVRFALLRLRAFAHRVLHYIKRKVFA